MDDVRSRTTLEDVARVAGVSRATASRAVRGGELVSPVALEAVRRAVEQLGYVPNPAARSLVTRQTDTLAVVVPEDDARVFSDPFIAQAIGGVAEALAHTPKQLVLLMRARGQENKRLLPYLRGGHVDGIVVLSHHRDDHLERELAALHLPLAFIGRPLEPQLAVPYVDVDNVAGGRLAAEHLLAAGARRLATISGPLDMPAAVDRITGWSEALAEAGVTEVARYEGDFTLVRGEELGARLLAEHPEVDGVFAANDLTAAGVLNAARAAGRSVPRTLRLVGYDDTQLGLTTHPQLTTITNPGRDLARRATRMVLDQLAGQPAPPPIIITPVLVERASG